MTPIVWFHHGRAPQGFRAQKGFEVAGQDPRQSRLRWLDFVPLPADGADSLSEMTAKLWNIRRFLTLMYSAKSRQKDTAADHNEDRYRARKCREFEGCSIFRGSSKLLCFWSRK